MVFLELEVIEVKSLCLRSLLDVLDCATSLVLVVFLPKELWMLIPQVDVVRVRVVLEELWQFLWWSVFLGAKNERFKAGCGLVLPFCYSINDLLLFFRVRRERFIGNWVKVS